MKKKVHPWLTTVAEVILMLEFFYIFTSIYIVYVRVGSTWSYYIFGGVGILILYYRLKREVEK